MTLQKFRVRPKRRIRNPKQRCGSRLIVRTCVAIPEDAVCDWDGDRRVLPSCPRRRASGLQRQAAVDRERLGEEGVVVLGFVLVGVAVLLLIVLVLGVVLE